jgi:radical SAM superfamily enzyme YgiQ (UPF0313 family)
MKVALIQTPCWGIVCPPYGIAVLAAYLRNIGHQVYIKDLNIEFYYEKRNKYTNEWNPENHSFWINPRTVSNFIFDHSEIIDKMVNDILNTEAEIIGFSIHFSSEHIAKEIARRIKEKDKKRTIVFGGPQASRVNSGFHLAGLDYVDFVVQGEGEITLGEIVRMSAINKNIDFCQGSILKRCGEVVDCGDRPLILDLDSLPFADFGDFDFSGYQEPFRLPISLSRGCPNRCIFCNEKPYWRSFRFRKAENVFLEIKYQIKKIGKIDYIDFSDSLINGNIKELEKLCGLIIAERLRIRWGGQAAVSKDMTYNLLLKMKKAGCICLNYGLETGSHRIMQSMGKILAKDADIDRVIQDAHNVGIDCILNFMFGFPGETEKDFQETLEFLSRNRDFIDMVNPSPGFCAFEKGSYAYGHPDEFDIVLGECGALWESKDGTNNYATRLERFERFLIRVKELEIKNFYPYTQLHNRDTVLGHYYFTKKEWAKAISHLNEAVKQQPKNESNWIYLAKSLAYIGTKDKAKECFDEIVKIKLAKMDLGGAQEIIVEAKEMGIVCSL